jgi:uncharacterized membrane protein HdeD (DUF308 family)
MLAGVVLAALVGAGFVAGRWGRPGAVALASVSVLWLLVNGPMEGRVLVRVNETRGLTEGDLAGLAGLLLALVLLVFPRDG